MAPVSREIVPCHNMSVLFGPGDGTTETYSNDSMTTSRSVGSDDDINAVIYIVVVLLFYSMGIIIAIISYLKKERQEMVEEKAYEDYMNFRADPDKWRRYFRVQRMVSHLNRVEQERKAEEERQRRLERESSLSHSDKGHSVHSGFSLKFHRLSLIRKLSKDTKCEKSPEIHISPAQPELLPLQSPVIVSASRRALPVSRSPEPEPSCSKWKFPEPRTPETVFENGTPALEPKSPEASSTRTRLYHSIKLPLGRGSPEPPQSLGASSQEVKLLETRSVESDSQERIKAEGDEGATSPTLSLETCL